MTEQIRERLHYDGSDYYIRSFPLPNEMIEGAPLKRIGSLNSACRRGYVGQWEIKDGSLYLTSMDLKGFEPMPFEQIFKEVTEQGLEAKWFDGVLECDTGNVIRHAPYDVVFERTTTFTIQQGRVVSEETRMN